MPPDPRLPARLRELRTQAHLTYRDLGARAAYSHVYLWRIERGERPAPPAVMRRVGEALGVGAELERLAHGTDAGLDGDHLQRLQAVEHDPGRVDRATLDGMATILTTHRRLEDQIGAGPMWAPARAQLQLAERVLGEATDGIRTAALDMAAQQAQFAGWLTLATGRRDARALFRRAERLAEDAGDHEMRATAISFVGYAARLAGRPAEVIEASHAARQIPGVYVGQIAYDVGQEARGHALRGDTRAALELLAEHRDLAEAAVAWTGPVAPWHYYRGAGFFRLERGLTLALLAQSTEERQHALAAVTELRGGLTAMPDDQRGAEWLADPFLLVLAATQRQLGDGVGAEQTQAEIRRIAAATGSTRLARAALLPGSSG